MKPARIGVNKKAACEVGNELAARKDLIKGMNIYKFIWNLVFNKGYCFCYVT